MHDDMSYKTIVLTNIKQRLRIMIIVAIPNSCCKYCNCILYGLYTVLHNNCLHPRLEILLKRIHKCS